MTIANHFVELDSHTKSLDIISDIKFSPFNQLAVSTWDNEILLYDCKNFLEPHEPPTKDPVAIIKTDDTPLCLLYTPLNQTFAGVLDGTVRILDFENMKLGSNIASEALNDEIGGGINNICNVEPLNAIACSSFNGKLQLLDPRQVKPIQVIPSTSPRQKITAMDTSDKFITCAMNANKIEIYDFRNLHQAMETREVGLKYQVKDLKTFPNNQGFALSTIDGRVLIEYFDSSPEVQQNKRFTFKCHRHQDSFTGADLVYPVNSIAFHKTYTSTLFTAGSDGTVCLWDCDKKKRMRQYPKFLSHEGEPESVVKIGLSKGDELIAVATSDDNYMRRRRLSESESLRAPSRIYIKCIGETECMPKRAT